MMKIICTAVVMLFGGLILWVKSLTSNRQSRIENEKDAYIEVIKNDSEADNSKPDSDLDKRVLDEFGDR